VSVSGWGRSIGRVFGRDTERGVIVAALFARPPGAAWLPALRGGLDHDRLLRLARDYGVAAVLCQRLAALQWQHELGVETWARLQAEDEQNRLQNLVLLADLGETAALLRAAGIPALALKGSALLATVYAEGLERHTDDIDLLLPADEVARAAALLHAAGYREYAPPALGPDGALTRNDDALRARDPHARHPSLLFGPRHTRIELHRHTDFGTGDEAQGVPESVWQRARTVTTRLGQAVSVPAEDDLLANLCCHVLRQHRREPRYRLRHLVDVDTLLGGADPAALAAMAALRGRCGPVEQSWALHEALAAALAARSEPRARARPALRALVARLMAPDPPAWLSHLRHGLAPAGQGWRPAWRALLPRRDYMAWRYGRPGVRGLRLALLHLLRWSGLGPGRPPQ